MNYTKSTITTRSFVVDPHSVTRDTGVQIDWTRVTVGTDGLKRLPGGTVLGKSAENKGVPLGTTNATSVTVTSNVATVTLAAHGYRVGDTVTLSGSADPAINGPHVITAVTVNTYQFAVTTTDGTKTGTTSMAAGARGILETNALENGVGDFAGYGFILGGVLYENLLPIAITAQTKAELDAVGTGFAWATYRDSRGE